jgi:hypothetical protein
MVSFLQPWPEKPGISASFIAHVGKIEPWCFNNNILNTVASAVESLLPDSIMATKEIYSFTEAHRPISAARRKIWPDFLIKGIIWHPGAQMHSRLLHSAGIDSAARWER